MVSCQWFYYTMPDSFKERIEQEFTFKYDGKDTGIDSLLDISGYYYLRVERDTSYSFSYMMFFKDGMFVQDRFYYTSNSKKDTPDFYYDIHRNDREYGFHLYERCTWGRYLIFGDTIKIQYVERPILYSQGSPWYAMEEWYKVIDNNTIREVFAKPIGINNTEKMHYYNARARSPLIQAFGIFVPAERIPSSDGWIKRGKWFWRNEEDWKNFMDSVINNRNDK